MFAALGVGAWEIAFFHLVTHAAFKALLFLASGSVIHGSGTQDLRRDGRAAPSDAGHVRRVARRRWCACRHPAARRASSARTRFSTRCGSPTRRSPDRSSSPCCSPASTRSAPPSSPSSASGAEPGTRTRARARCSFRSSSLRFPPLRSASPDRGSPRCLGEHPEPLVAAAVRCRGRRRARRRRSRVVHRPQTRTSEPQRVGVAASGWNLLGRGFGYDACDHALRRSADRRDLPRLMGDRRPVRHRRRRRGLRAWLRVPLSGLISKAQTGDGQSYAAFMALAVVVVLCALDPGGEVIAMMQLDLMMLVPAALAIVSVLVGAPRASGTPMDCAWLQSPRSAACSLRCPRPGSSRATRILGWNGASTRGAWQVVIDGLSLPLVLLTLFIGVAAIRQFLEDLRTPGHLLRAHLGAAGRGHRRLPRREPPAVLRRVGVRAHPDVLPHRRLGFVEPQARRDEVPRLHLRSRWRDAARRHPDARHVWRRDLDRRRSSRTTPRSRRRRSSSGSSWSASSSRSRRSRSTPGCLTRTPRRPPPGRSSSPA